ncbi:TonB-dependent receptor [gamma proteobacterium BDW918]|nr:TonB-dependent receptor [gamma proteobacterium BDW918]
MRATVDARYEDDFYGIFTHAPASKQEAYIMSNASLTYYNEANGWSLGAWVKNIEDEDVQAVIGLGPVPGAAGPSLAFLQPPRTFGLRFTYDL